MRYINEISLGARLKSSASTALDFILPARCPNCSAKITAHGFLCPSCWGDLQPLAAPFCGRCALPFEFAAEDGDECGACLLAPPDFDWARAAVSYEDLGRTLVLRLKHGAASSVVPAMAQMMVGALTGKTADVIVPVPLHRSRLMARRFNQSQLIAHALAGRLSMSVDCFSLIKKKPTESQGGLNRKARFLNVAASFAVKGGRAPHVAGKDILLVDDVLTTGATASVCARVLKKAGAKSVGVITFARVGRPVSA